VGGFSAFIGLVTGAATFAVCWYWAKHTDHHKDALRRATAIHFRIDASSAVATAAGSLLAYMTGQSRWIFLAAGWILCLSWLDSWPEMRKQLGGLHRASDHNGTDSDA
jgi:hypothetical protein